MIHTLCINPPGVSLVTGLEKERNESIWFSEYHMV